ncbi:hypothetical protein FB107DRAFT_214210, partial [Schizophyllum commune]
TESYERIYEEEDYGEELGPNAPFWRVFLEESEVYDKELVEGWRDSLDVLLVFAGLFSAVLITLLVQSSLALQPDYAYISASLMIELIAVQRAWARGSAVDDVPPSGVTLESVTATSLDYWCNGLWYTSLALSLSVALLAVLVKEWIQAYASSTSGDPKNQALVRQFRFSGIERWNVPLIIGFLPTLLHLALFLFFVGLSIYTFTFDQTIAWVVLGISATVFLLYFMATILPIFDDQCPYKTPLSRACQHVLAWIPSDWLVDDSSSDLRCADLG